MSTLSKVFVVLVFVVALFKLGVDATLFAQRVDWKDKFVKEVNYHYQTQAIKNAEISDLNVQVESLNNYTQKLNEKIGALDNERAALATRLASQGRDMDSLQANYQKLTATLEVQVRQLDVQLTQIQEMTNKVEDYRQRLAKANTEKLTAVQELQYVRQESERLSKDLASLEDSHQSLAREHLRTKEVIAELNKRGVQTDLVSPSKVVEAKVTAVDANIGLVIISVGRDDGVLEGNEFTIYRGSNFVAKIVVDKVDRKWSAARVTLKKEDPRVSDDATNNVMTSQFKGSGN